MQRSRLQGLGLREQAEDDCQRYSEGAGTTEQRQTRNTLGSLEEKKDHPHGINGVLSF